MHTPIRSHHRTALADVLVYIPAKSATVNYEASKRNPGKITLVIVGIGKRVTTIVTMYWVICWKQARINISCIVFSVLV